MISIVDVLNPLVWGLAALGAVAALFASSRPGREPRLTTAALLALAAVVLLGTVAVAEWFPPQALVLHPDGSTGDPRAVSAVLLGVAAVVALAPLLRALALPATGVVGQLVPGVVLAGVVAAVCYFLGLRAPIAIAGLVFASVALASGLVLFARLRASGPGWLALQVGATGLLVAAATVSLHGARLDSLRLDEGAAVDTLGSRVVLSAVKAPNDSVRTIEYTILRGGKAAVVGARIEGRAGTENRSVVGGGLFGGMLVAPLALDETQPRPHDLVWVSRGDTVTAGGSTVRFVGFRMVPGDTVRMLADLDVTTAGVTQRVSPGMYATAEGTTPFPAMAEGLGPVVVGKVDADNGRIALMLPTPSTSGVQRAVIANLHTRPMLEWAWVGGLLVVLAFALGLVARGEPETPAA